MLENFITASVGKTKDIWEKNADLNYLYKCAKAFRVDRLHYAEKIFNTISPRINNSKDLNELYEIIKNLVDQADLKNDSEIDIYNSQAIEIVANDFWLLNEMVKQKTDQKLIFLLKKEIESDAINVGIRLFRNAKRKIQALHYANKELDKSKILPLKDLTISPLTELNLSADIKKIHLIINAGRSTRVRTTIPKGTIYLENQPLIQYTIDAGKKAGFEKTIVVLGFKKEINSLILDDTIDIVTQPTIEGTAHAVKYAYPALKSFKGTLMISYSDMPFIKATTLNKFLREHEKNDALMTILTTSSEKRPEFGRLLEDENGNYLRVAQVRVEQVEANQADVGFYCFKCPEFWQYLNCVENRNNRYEYYLTDVMNQISSKNKKIKGYETLDEIETTGINRPNELIKAFEIGYFIFNKKYTYEELNECYKNTPEKFNRDLAEFYKRFLASQVKDEKSKQDLSIYPKLNLEREPLFDIVNKKLSNQIGALFSF